LYAKAEKYLATVVVPLDKCRLLKERKEDSIFQTFTVVIFIDSIRLVRFKNGLHHLYQRTSNHDTKLQPLESKDALGSAPCRFNHGLMVCNGQTLKLDVDLQVVPFLNFSLLSPKT
jgi:hypothetical protein